MIIQPLVSVIIPCYNQANYLSETIESVINQSYKNWECIIVNDGSTDNTDEIALKYCKIDYRILSITKPNGGLASARNYGIKHSKGIYVLPLDSDDLISRHYIEDAVNVFSYNPLTKLVYSKVEFFGEKQGEWELPAYSFNRLLHTNHIFCSCFYKREDYMKTGGYVEKLKIGWEDWDFLIKLLDYDDVVYQIPKVHFFYRIRSNSMLRSMTGEEEKSLYKEIFLENIDKYIKYINVIPLIQQNEEKSLLINKLSSKIKRIEDSWEYRFLKILKSFVKVLILKKDKQE